MNLRSFGNGRGEARAAKTVSAVSRKLLSEAIGVYIWFLQFSGFLLKLVQ
ncbi:MAG: hypothetical protein JSS81_03255 [Acidobacteria bacterium]|nr:hypothetical protein [Acidobacteriota bacterium]